METKQRASGIELLKIFAILLIVVSHVTQTLTSFNENFPSDYVIDVAVASNSLRNFILLLFRYFGQQGNYIFFVCSAWFLVESEKMKPRKIFSMLADTWIVSVIILFAFFVSGVFKLPLRMWLYNLFPTTFANNWYITCYLLFYAIHPALNIVIKNLEKRNFLISVCVMSFLYFGISFLRPFSFFGSSLIDFVVIYFIVAFIKIYCFDFCKDKKLNFAIFVLGIIFHILLLSMTNFLGLRFSFLSNQLLRWCGSNPFLLMIAISLANIFRERNFSNKAINYISSLSLLIYIIHENLLVRTYLRPLVFIWIKSRFGYSNIVLWVLFYSLVLFLIATLLAIIYKETIGRFVHKVISKK